MESINRLSQMVGYSVSDSRGHFYLMWDRCQFGSRLAGSISNGPLFSYGPLSCKAVKIGRSAFEAMHMGWDRFYKYKTENEISNKELVEYSATIKGPARIAQICSSMGIDYPLPALLVPSSCHYSWPKLLIYLDSVLMQS